MIEKKILEKFISQGLNIIPVTDKKVPAIKGWKKYQSEMVNLDDMPNYDSVAIITGKVSGNLELIDIDQKYCLHGTLRDRYKQLVDDFSPGLWDKLVECKTKNKGFHLVYRCPQIGTNIKLASRPSTPEELENKKEKFKVLIETRSEGGYFLCKPTVGYDVVTNILLDPPTITKEEREVLFRAARALDEVPLPLWESQAKPQFNSKGIPSWEVFDDSDEWLDIMKSDGWSIQRETDTKIFLRRPGDSDSKYSGNFDKRHRLLRVFSSSTEFDTSKSYSPSAIFTVLRAGGDFRQGARMLLEMGFGKVPEKNLQRKDEEVELDSDDDMVYDKSEDDNIMLLAKGKLELGKSTGYTSLDEFFKHKKGYFNILGSHANLGKSWFTWNLILAFCLDNNEKYIIYSPENKVWTIKYNMIRFILGKDPSRLSESDIKNAISIIDKHITFIESEDILSFYAVLEYADKLLKKDKYYGVLIDPYNSLDFDWSRSDRKLNSYEYHFNAARTMKNWSSTRGVTIWATMHGVTEAQRKVHTDKEYKGLIKPLIAADLEYGGMWVNACMDMLILHRYASHPDLKNQTQIHTVKIKEDWNGGKRTMQNEPVILTLNNGDKDFFGFWCEKGSNPFFNYAKKLNFVSTKEEEVQPSEHVYDTFEENEEQQAVHNYNQGHTLRGSRPSIEEEEEDDTPY